VRSLGVSVLLVLAYCSGDARTGIGQRPPVSSPAVAATGDPNDPLSRCGFYDDQKTVFQPHFAERNVVSRVKPEYPSSAVAERIEGDVDVTIRIHGDGRVVKACATSGPEPLRQAAEMAALQWTFRAHGGVMDHVDHIVFTFKVGDP
jgi:outer membrane biosynthesis protein TonB